MLISVTEAVILSGLCGERIPFQNRERTGSPSGHPAWGGGCDRVLLTVKQNPVATAPGSDYSGAYLWISTA